MSSINSKTEKVNKENISGRKTKKNRLILSQVDLLTLTQLPITEDEISKNKICLRKSNSK